MKRSAIRTRVTAVNENIRAMIESAPVRSVLAAFFLGVIAAIFKDLLVPLILLLLAVMAVFWFLAENDESQTGN